MCLAIPARLVEYLDEDRMFGKVELGGVQRRVNTLLLVGPDACEPGEYVLQVLANDYSGDGGGGFVCCWTNTLVKVTVTP